MIARWITNGDAAGLIRYISYDSPTASDRRPEKTDRVKFFWSINGGETPEEVAAEIQQLVADAPQLKAAAGISSRGRKSTKCMGYLMISWEPGAVITEAHAGEVGHKAILALGLKDHIGVMAFHSDRPHPLLHIAICRIDPETGRTINTRNPAQGLSAFAREYEKAHGIVVPLRESIAQARERALAAEPGSAEQRQAQELEQQLRRGRERRRGPERGHT